MDKSGNPFEGIIELSWPGKNCKLEYTNGKWRLTPYGHIIQRRALIYDSGINDGDVLGYCVKGDVITALTSLHPYTPSSVKFVYFDSPRLNVFQEESVGGYSISTWLSLVQETARLALPCIKRDGFFAVHTDEQTCHYARMVLEDVFGRNCYVGTFAWQKQYAPQNDHNVPTDVLDYIIVFSKCPAEELSKIGIIVTPRELQDDGDFRGCYTAGHKGARSGSEATKFRINASPYRWEIVDSKLPDGRFHFDKILGTLWFQSVNSVGEFYVKVRATDKNGETAERTINFSIRERKSVDDEYQLPQRIWWLLKKDNDITHGSDLSIVDLEPSELEGIKGQEFSLVFKAKGGEPFTMRNDSPGAGRYWEFGLKTLIEGIARAKVSFGPSGTALPSIKKYFDRSNAKKVQAVMNFLPWYDFGHTQDATQHCKSLKKASITQGKINMTAKPQKLLAHLISLLAPDEKDMVMSIGDSNAVFGCVAIKMHRRFIHITGSSKEDLQAWNDSASKRIHATILNQDTKEIEGNDTFSHDVCSGGRVDILKVSDSFLSYNDRSGDLEPVFAPDEDTDEIYAGLAGAYRATHFADSFKGIDGRTVVVVPEDEELDAFLLDDYRHKYPDDKLIIVYESMEGNLSTPKNTILRRAPFDLI